MKNTKKNSKQILFEMMHKVGGMPLNENMVYSTNPDIRKNIDSHYSNKYLDIAKREYKKEMDEFIEAAKKDIAHDDKMFYAGDHEKPRDKSYNVYNKFGHAGLNALELAKWDPELAAQIMGAMWVSYDKDGHGESTIISALGNHGWDEKEDSLDVIKNVWGVNLD